MGHALDGLAVAGGRDGGGCEEKEGCSEQGCLAGQPNRNEEGER